MKFHHPKTSPTSPLAEQALLLRLKTSKDKNHINSLIHKHCPAHADKIHTQCVVVPDSKTRLIGKVIGKSGSTLREIERITNTYIRLRKEEGARFMVTRQKHGDLWKACEMISNILGDEDVRSDAEYTDWEKYYFWWYYYNKERK